jgi:hypothetical protein
LISTPILESLESIFDVRGRAESPVGNVGDLLGFLPLPLQLFDLEPLVDGHLERQPTFGAE